MTFDMENYHATNTDVWVFGSPDQYLAFASLLTSHKEPQRIPAVQRGGMDILILPIANDVTCDFVVIHERLVHQEGRFNMELIIGGSQAGFECLAQAFRRSARFHANNPDDHLHFDCDEEMLILPSVFLNIRGPVKDIEAHLEELAPPSPDELPSDMAWRDPELWTYQPLTDYGSLFGRMPIKNTN